MPAIEFLGWLSAAWMGTTALPGGNAINDYNNHFAMEVDRGSSCFTRVSGFEGVYGGPEEFELDGLCNYRIHRTPVEGTVYQWSIERK